MATRKTSSAAKSRVEEPVTVVEESAVEQEAAPVAIEEKKKKKFESNDGVKCVSITSGTLIMVGQKTGIVYRWVSEGDAVYVEYADLVAEVRTKGNYAFRPRFVVDDNDFIAEFPELDTLYASLYSKNDLKQILKLDANKMKSVITQLPEGAKESIKSLAITAIERGELDSINRIKVIDEIFGTDMLLKMSS